MSRIVPKKENRPNGTYWVVSMGSRFTGTSRQRRYFRRLQDAREFVLEADEARYKLGCEAFVLPL